MNTDTLPSLADVEIDDEWHSFGHEGSTYRVRTMADEEGYTLDDLAEGYGSLAWVTDDQRPEGFNGRARKLYAPAWAHDPVWWQPHPNADPATDNDMAHAVSELLAFGFIGVVCERIEQCDHGHTHAVDHASLWGIEWNADRDYLVDVLGDLVDEMSDR